MTTGLTRSRTSRDQLVKSCPGLTRLLRGQVIPQGCNPSGQKPHSVSPPLIVILITTIKPGHISASMLSQFLRASSGSVRRQQPRLDERPRPVIGVKHRGYSYRSSGRFMVLTGPWWLHGDLQKWSCMHLMQVVRSCTDQRRGQCILGQVVQTTARLG